MSERNTWRLAVVLVLVGLFAVVAGQVVGHGMLTDVDRSVRDWLAAHGAPRRREVYSWLIWPGSPQAVAVVLGGTALWLAMRERSLRPVLMAATLAGAALVVVLAMKYGFNRQSSFIRPHHVRPGHGAFPSGHTAGAVLAFGGAAWLLWGHVSARARRWLVGVAVVAALWEASLLVLFAYHWLSDVLASLLLLPVLMIVVASAWEWAEGRLVTVRSGVVPEVEHPAAEPPAESPTVVDRRA